LAAGRTYMDTQLLKSRWITLGVRPRYRVNFTAQPQRQRRCFERTDRTNPVLARTFVLQELTCQLVSLCNTLVCNVPLLQFDSDQLLLFLAYIT